MHTRSLRTDASPIMSKLILAQVDPDGHMEYVGDLITCGECINMRSFAVLNEAYVYCPNTGHIVEENDHCCWAVRKES